MRPAWQQDPACRGHGASEFVRDPRATYDELRALCEGCRVRQECLEFALADTDITGLWGGTTDAERRELLRAVAVA